MHTLTYPLTLHAYTHTHLQRLGALPEELPQPRVGDAAAVALDQRQAARLLASYLSQPRVRHVLALTQHDRPP